MRCDHCKKRLALVEETVGRCKCEKTFCQKHREPHAHECTYDFHEKQKEMLAEKMAKNKQGKQVNMVF